MAFTFSRTRVSPIAIDFGSHRLKLLQVVPGRPPQLVAAAAAPMPESARNDASARQAFLAATLRDLLKRQPFKGRRTICSLPAYQTLVQNLEVGRGENEAMDTVIADQLRQRMNVDPTRMVIRHHHLGQVMRNGSTLQHVLCLAASREVVMQYVQLCAECKLDLVGMHSEPIAILRAFSSLQTQPDQAVCYIDLGATTTKLVIAHGDKMVFAKSIHVATNTMRESAQMARQLAATHAGGSLASNVQAEAMQDHADMAMLNAETSAASEFSHREQGGHQSEPDNDAIECIVDELQMCLRYHKSLFPEQAVKKLVFLGGSAKHMQTCQHIAREVRVAAQLGDPLASLSRLTASKPATGVDLSQSQPGWTVPFGLCHSEANL